MRQMVSVRVNLLRSTSWVTTINCHLFASNCDLINGAVHTRNAQLREMMRDDLASSTFEC